MIRIRMPTKTFFLSEGGILHVWLKTSETAFRRYKDAASSYIDIYIYTHTM